MENLSTEKAMLDIELKEAQNEVVALRGRQQHLEEQLFAQSLKENTASTKAAGLEERIGQLVPIACLLLLRNVCTD